MHHTTTILLASLLLFPLSALAQTEVPNAFSDGTPALAAEVNENFTAVADGVNAQDVRIQNVESAIAGPEKMVFLGYAEGSGSSTDLNHYAKNQSCKDTYSNPAASVMTVEVWTTFIAEQQMPLPSQLAGVKSPRDAIYAGSNGSGGGTLYSPLLGTAVYPDKAYCVITTIGQIGCYANVYYELTACMAPAG